MPRQHVYGKPRGITNTFKLSAIFSSTPSPAKPDTADCDGDVDAVTGLLEDLKVSTATRPLSRKVETRKALKSKDGNLRATNPCSGSLEKVAMEKNDRAIVRTKRIALETEVVPARCSRPLRKTETQRIGEACTLPSESYIQSLLALSTNPTCSQEFTTWSKALEPFFSISKIAEASYGEVYRLSLSAPHPRFTSTDESVLKILALKASPTQSQKKTKQELKREANMSSIDSVVSEVKLLKRLTEIPGFTNFRALHILRGRPSPGFVSAWKTWNKSRSEEQKSAFPDPSRKLNYSDEQLWAVIEMQDAGTDVERLLDSGDGQMRTVEGIWDVFWGVALAVGKGEELVGFEHRDLHLGNVCVKMGKGNGRKNRRKLGFTGLETTIIDYTLSRAEMCGRQPSPHSFSSLGSMTTSSTTLSVPEKQEEDDVAYLDLSCDEDIFNGDATDEYQYEVYRLMRNAMYFSNALHDYSEHSLEAEATGRSWRGFHPQTNLVWLHYVLETLMTGISEQSCVPTKQTTDREKILREIQGLLNIASIPREGLASTRDLIAIALAEEWLDEEDVVGPGVAASFEAPSTRHRNCERV